MRACSVPIRALYALIWVVSTRSVPLRRPILPRVVWIFFWTSLSRLDGEAPSEGRGRNAHRANGSATAAISRRIRMAARDASDRRAVVWQDLFHASSHVVRP